ncbi:hypothetical protein F5Y03DRAFT_365272 [Xylaria venustula]|nr:hypothetical protein F5Y03DRAFT_365272 [Xylaria venustula]
MGNLKDRIKATLLRRDSRRQSPSPSKNSLGGDNASGASTHTHPGYDASDECSDHGVRGSSRSLSLGLSLTQDGAISGSGSESGSQSQSQSHGRSSLCYASSPAPTSDTNVSAVTTDKLRKKPVYSNGRAHRTDNDGLPADKVDMTDSPGAGPDAAPVRVGKGARNAPPSLQAGPDPEALNSSTNAISLLGKDQHGSSTNPTAPINITTPTSTNTINNTTQTTPTTVITTITGVVAATHNAATGNGTVIVATNGAALPSIHEHPATPPTLPSASPESDLTSPEPPGTFSRVDHTDHTRDGIARTIDDSLASASLLTPLTASPLRSPLSSSTRPLGPLRRQSILPPHQTDLVQALLHDNTSDFELDSNDPNTQQLLSGMVTTKIWVKRPMASATLITINEDDLVDDVREQILRKYANSLGRQFDAPDLTIRICNREQQTSRILQPDEPIVKVIDSYYAKGQTVDDALLIDIPSRRTPKASPNPRFYTDDRPHESGTDYFPPYPPASTSHSHHAITSTLVAGQHALHFPPSMSIVGGSQLPPLPSPGSARRVPINRPNMQRMHTSSPVSTVASSHPPQVGPISTGTHKYPRPVRSRTHSGASSDQSSHAPAAPPIATPPPVERTATPPPRVSSPRPSVRTKKKKAIEPPSLPSGFLDSAVPPINILIVEDNVINLRLLEAFVKRLKVRWQTAVNGKEAVDKWRAGGFHLVLMDIQLPIMSGLEATREIRRIEKVNSIGVFSSSASSPPDDVLPEPKEEDKLANTEMFKSPVIIVALTASALQSDRHDALAAGCNDFLTKVSISHVLIQWSLIPRTNTLT